MEWIKIRDSFEDWYLSFPDNDESILKEKIAEGHTYKNIDVNRMWVCFRAGFKHGYRYSTEDK